MDKLQTIRRFDFLPVIFLCKTMILPTNVHFGRDPSPAAGTPAAEKGRNAPLSGGIPQGLELLPPAGGHPSTEGVPVHPPQIGQVQGRPDQGVQQEGITDRLPQGADLSLIHIFS